MQIHELNKWFEALKDKFGYFRFSTVIPSKSNDIVTNGGQQQLSEQVGIVQKLQSVVSLLNCGG